MTDCHNLLQGGISQQSTARSRNHMSNPGGDGKCKEKQDRISEYKGGKGDRKRNVSNDKVNQERAVKQKSGGKSIWRVVSYQESLTICGGDNQRTREVRSFLGIGKQVSK